MDKKQENIQAPAQLEAAKTETAEATVVDYTTLEKEELVKLLTERDEALKTLQSEVETLTELLSEEPEKVELSDEDQKIIYNAKLAPSYKTAVKVKGKWMAAVTDYINGKSLHGLEDEEYDELLADGTVFSEIE